MYNIKKKSKTGEKKKKTRTEESPMPNVHSVRLQQKRCCPAQAACSPSDSHHSCPLHRVHQILTASRPLSSTAAHLNCQSSFSFVQMPWGAPGCFLPTCNPVSVLNDTLCHVPTSVDVLCSVRCRVLHFATSCSEEG